MDDIGVEAFRTDELDTLPGANFFLQSWQILLRSLSSSSDSVVTIIVGQLDLLICNNSTHLVENIYLTSFAKRRVRP